MTHSSLFAQVINQIERIEVNKSSGGKVNKRRTSSALSSNGFKLFKELLHFIEKCGRLESVTFESVDLPIEVLPPLGRALVASRSGESHDFNTLICCIDAEAAQRSTGWASTRATWAVTTDCTC